MAWRSAATVGVVLCCAARLLAQNAAAPIFRANSNLQSVAVEVVDKQGDAVGGLTAADFTLFEDGRPQKIAFFGSQDQPIRLTILLDSSRSMGSDEKLQRTRELLRPLMRGTLPGDEISLVPFTSQLGSFVPLTLEQRVKPPTVALSAMKGGTALYDAIASAVCHTRGTSLRQSIVVITDGADQNSRLKIEQLIGLVRTSRPQIFVIGFMGKGEFDYYRDRGDRVTVVSGREVDNPVRAFRRISRESGAESFFPATDRDLKHVLERVMALLHAQYTLAYYPENVDKLRKIRVKVQRSGVTVRAPRTVAAQPAHFESVQFEAGSCLVSTKAHPYPWERHVTHTTAGVITYRDDFSDSQSGWPEHRGSRYVAGGYEMSGDGDAQVLGESVRLAAYGPWWYDFRASVFVDEERSHADADGMIFRLNERGYYAVLLQNAADSQGFHGEYFKVIRQRWFDLERILVPWTRIQTDLKPSKERKIMVECRGKQITIYLDGLQAAEFKDDAFADGYVGMTKIGYGRALFRDLQETLLTAEGSR
jgi:VWFA-related protein